MAWTCTGRSNEELIDKLRKAGLINSRRVASAMSQTDRRHYVPEKEYAYQDSPQPIGFNATISAPHMHAHALEDLEDFLRPGMRVLDVGCGSGYLTAVMHRMVSPTDSDIKGTVIGIDHLSGLTDLSVRNLKNDGVETGSGKGIEIVTGDGRNGWSLGAPYDAIHVGAAASTLPPALVDQLKSPGRMFIPVGSSEQAIWRVDKAKDGTLTKTELFGVRYVPLTDKKAQWSA
ncbi:hypothetical protein NliqN6_2856 [Naganishia liquefaciens]|uniref:Protein-L-isoaspartate O-methyltransferase n=1 Tax=Naganishia liquefaciens TaxID=104408 RepID=A0A8H3YEG7_9TREE|nr:hypothetical protein NliqN6_2856 [Naganishia liquefaciens]